MGLFSFNQEIAIDLGTANTIIMADDQIVVDEPSVVAINVAENKMIAVGRKAQQMIGKGGVQIRTVRPLREGVIADFYACEMMIRGMIKLMPKQSRFLTPNLKMVVCIPSGSTEVEIRAVRDSSEHAGGRDVYMIFEPMAAAIGMGIDVESPEGCMDLHIQCLFLKVTYYPSQDAVQIPKFFILLNTYKSEGRWLSCASCKSGVSQHYELSESRAWSHMSHLSWNTQRRKRGRQPPVSLGCHLAANHPLLRCRFLCALMTSKYCVP